MAQRVETTITDDITGEPDASTVRFGLDGQEYEIDLTGANAEGLRSALTGYVEAGRKVKRNGAPERKSQGSRDPRPGQIREWARQRGIAVNWRGRLPAEVVAQFEREQGVAA